MKNLWVSILILSILGCNTQHTEKENILIDAFPKSIELKNHTDLIVPNILLNPVRMCIVDSFLLILQQRDNSMLNIFLLPDCRHICDFGNKGNGPNEFVLSFNTSFNPVHGKNSGFTLGNKMVDIRYYKIKDIIHNNVAPYKEVSLPVKLSRFRALINIADSVIYGQPYGGNMEMFKYNNNSEILEVFKEFPKGYPLLDNQFKTELYAYYLASKPDNKKFVKVFASEGKFEIYNLETNTSNLILYKNFPSLKDNYKINNSSKYLSHDENMKVFCQEVHATNQYIYAEIYNDKYKNIYDKDGFLREFIPEIHVLDWSGNPVAILKLNEYYSYFSVDMDDKYLYTCDNFVSDTIKRYDLEQLF